MDTIPPMPTVPISASPGLDALCCSPRASSGQAARILILADEVVTARVSMDEFIGDRRGTAAIAAMLHPAFRERVSDMAAAFTELTAAVDRCEISGIEWRHLIADQRVLAGLEAGIAASQRLVVDRAVAKFRQQL